MKCFSPGRRVAHLQSITSRTITQVLFALEERRERKLHDVVRQLQAAWRSFLTRRYFLRLREKSYGIFSGQKRALRSNPSVAL